MTPFLALLARALGVGPALSPAQPADAGAATVTPAFGDPSTLRLPMMGGAQQAGAPVEAPAQSQTAAMPDAGVTPQFRASSASGLPQRADSAPAPIDPSALPTPPVMPKSGHLGDVLDNVLLGGSFRKAREAEYADQAKNYNDALARAVGMRNMGLIASLPQKAQVAAALSPTDTGKEIASNYGFHDVADGHTGLYGDGSTMFAPKLDEKSGSFVAPGPNGGIVSSPSVGGGYEAKDGLVLSGRTGDVSARYALPQKLAPGERVASFAPGIPGQPGAGPPLPQVAPAPAFVSPSDVTSALPGARISSGYRTPAHNAAVGGVPDSWHTVGTPEAPGAVDVVPPAGMGMGAAASALARRLPQVRTLNEGDHLHVQPNARNTGAGLPQQGQGALSTDATGSLIDNGPGSAPIYDAPHFNPATGKYEQFNRATGEKAPGDAPAFSVPQVLEMRKSFQDSEVAKTANAATYALNSLRDAMGKSAKNNGVIDMAAIMNLSKSETGGVPRQGQVKTILDHFGLPQDIENRIMSTVGNGALTPESLRQVMGMLESYTTASRSIAQQRLDNDEAMANSYGQSLKLKLPDVAPAPKVNWMGDNNPPSPPAANTPPPPVGFVNKLGLRYNGGNPLEAGSWSKVVGR